jgi:hypothetical protein
MKLAVYTALWFISSSAYAQDTWYTITQYGDRCHVEDPVLQEQKLKAANNYLHTVPMQAPNGEVVDKIIVSRDKHGFVYFRDPTVCEYARRDAIAHNMFKEQL